MAFINSCRSAIEIVTSFALALGPAVNQVRLGPLYLSSHIQNARLVQVGAMGNGPSPFHSRSLQFFTLMEQKMQVFLWRPILGREDSPPRIPSSTFHS
jgi:hypothetical protein